MPTHKNSLEKLFLVQTSARFLLPIEPDSWATLPTPEMHIKRNYLAIALLNDQGSNRRIQVLLASVSLLTQLFLSGEINYEVTKLNNWRFLRIAINRLILLYV